MWARCEKCTTGEVDLLLGKFPVNTGLAMAEEPTRCSRRGFVENHGMQPRQSGRTAIYQGKCERRVQADEAANDNPHQNPHASQPPEEVCRPSHFFPGRCRGQSLTEPPTNAGPTTVIKCLTTATPQPSFLAERRAVSSVSLLMFRGRAWPGPISGRAGGCDSPEANRHKGVAGPATPRLFAPVI